MSERTSSPERWRPWGREGGGRLDAVVGALLCLIVLAAAGAIGLALKQPWLFPSLGPTVMLFFASPAEKSSRPVNALVGHLVALAVGYAAFVTFGLTGMQSAPVGGLTPAYLAAGATSVAVTTLVLQLIRLPHPPAGATTLIVSLGILSTPPDLLVMTGAVVLVVAAGWALNVARGRWRSTTTGR
ncbi:HPP family protein [Herbiconiux sp. A18JL235]|uniref:HPP family protein n=1 Tax=Herbiconiux sp. A18JL235 TaxID=3152363 RepID=A0AB39BGT9_9MICO